MNPSLFQNGVALHCEFYWKQENKTDFNLLVLIIKLNDSKTIELSNEKRIKFCG